MLRSMWSPMPSGHDFSIADLPLEGRCVPMCEESTVGLTFYRLILSNAVLLNVIEVATALIRSALNWPGQYDAAKMVVEVIESQALVWLGSMLSPVLPLIACIGLVFAFNAKLLAGYLYAPPSAFYSASRTSNATFSFMLVALALCSCFVVFQLQWERKRCGPLVGTSMFKAVTNHIEKTPNAIKGTLKWLSNPLVLFGVIAVLAASLLLYRARYKRFFAEQERLLAEFMRYRTEMQAKVVITRRMGSNCSTPQGSTTPGVHGATTPVGTSNFTIPASYPRGSALVQQPGWHASG